MFQGLKFTKRAMDAAAGAGNLEMLKWLHEKQVGCTTDAMDMAAEMGHLEVVKVMNSCTCSGSALCFTFSPALNLGTSPTAF